MNDMVAARTIADHIVRHGRPRDLDAICDYAANVELRQAIPVATVRKFVLAVQEAAPRDYDSIVRYMDDHERTLFDNAIAASVKKIRSGR